MIGLTTRQRDILQLLLQAHEPQGAQDLADALQLTPRQVNYCLKGLDSWLKHRGVAMKVTPGVGVTLAASTERFASIQKELTQDTHFQLVLSTDQRYQLLAFSLLVAEEPFIAYNLQQLLQVSRTTILKDLDTVESWLPDHALTLTRRPNYGIWIEGTELQRRQALLALLWGDVPFAGPLFTITHADRLAFALHDESDLLPVVKHVKERIEQWDVSRMLSHVTYAEAQLGGRYTDDAVLVLALSLAIQTWRVAQGQTAVVDKEQTDWLRSLPVWELATDMAHRLGWRQIKKWPDGEIAALAMILLTAPRNDRWPGDLEIDAVFSEVIDDLLAHVAAAYGMPTLAQDSSLRDGLLTHLIPACLRQRFGLWLPASFASANLPTRYGFEVELAQELVKMITAKTAVTLPTSERDALVLLLRAAYIRERPTQQREVIVVCPSGMATAQLLVARLKTRFPRLGTPRVMSLREVNQHTLANAELVVTTVPLKIAAGSDTAVIQVHPLLLPEDIDAITAWLS